MMASKVGVATPRNHIETRSSTVTSAFRHSLLGEQSVPFGFENATCYPAPGQMIFYPGGYSETEVLLAYGGVNFASKLGQLAGNHFLTIVEGAEKLPELGRRTLWEGAQDVLVERP